MKEIKGFTIIGLLLFFYLVTYYFFQGIIHPIPALGDSWDYHIPIAKSLLNGSFLSLHDVKLPQWYYPGSSEIFLALFMLLHIPLTLSNLFATLVLFFCCYRLARVFQLEYYLSWFFAITICTLTVIVRWYNAVSIDVWLTVFFLLSITILERLENKWQQYAVLGVTLGMVIGSKYTAVLFVILLFVVYVPKFRRTISFLRVCAFLVPFSFFGLFWYVRNYLLLHNPFYPLPILGFPGKKIFTDTVLSVGIHEPLDMVNAVFGEYKLWMIAPVLALAFVLYTWKKRQGEEQVVRLIIIGLFCLGFYFFFPTSRQPWIMVSSLRYSYPAFIPLILTVFLLSQRFKKGSWLGIFAIANMLPTLSLAYYPKLVLGYVPLALISYYLLEKYRPKEKKVIQQK